MIKNIIRDWLYPTVMRVIMEDPSPSPIDLRVAKPTDHSNETTLHPEVNSTIPSFYPREISNVPNFHSYMPTNLSPAENYVSTFHPLHSKEDHNARASSESGIDSPSPSTGNSPTGLEEPFPRNQTESKEEKPELIRRLSNGSTSSSLSNFSGDANNNGKCLDDKISLDKKNLKLSPEKKKIRLSSQDYCQTDVVVPFPKRENFFMEQPEHSISAFTNEIDICDSSTRSISTRPFKAITSGLIMDPLPLNGPLGDFETFRQSILSKVNHNNKTSNQNMRRQGNSANTHITDPAYWEKRKRNNEAAKRSRDARRRKEDEVAIRCAYLEQERILILQENKMLKEALQKYQYGFIRPIN